MPQTDGYRWLIVPVALIAAATLALAQDDSSTKLGPFPVRCEGISTTMTLTISDEEPQEAFLIWKDHVLLLKHTRSGSGARFAVKDEEGETVFWIKGSEASFERPGEASLTCQIESHSPDDMTFPGR